MSLEATDQKEQLDESQDYLSFGAESGEVFPRLAFSDTLEFLRIRGFANNSLSEAREKGNQHLQYEGYIDPDSHECDFCGKELTGIEYDVLKDGRERCKQCSDTVIQKNDEFIRLLNQTREGLCLKFNIQINVPIQVKVVSQSKISALTGETFIPSKKFDARAVGVAVNKRGKHFLYLENGAPRASLIATIAHELTHLWQYANWDMESMKKNLGKLYLPVVEGMAKWVEIQYMYLLNESDYALKMLENEILREDVYGFGLKLYLNQYQLSRDIVLKGATPFDKPSDPLDLKDFI